MKDSDGWAGEHDLPLLQFDPDRSAVLEPSESVFGRDGELPERAVLCFYADVLAELAASSKKIGQIEVAYGTHSIWSVCRSGVEIAVLHPGVGAPAAAAMLEEVIAMGCRSIVSVGGSAIVSPEVAPGEIIVPTSAIRDEGTSFHYVAPSSGITLDAAAVETVVEVLVERSVPHRQGRIWTTDGIYRETRRRVADRQEQGCLVVEMEVSALAAVCQFRQTRFAALLYAGDDVSQEKWAGQNWTESPARPTSFELALEASVRLAPHHDR